MNFYNYINELKVNLNLKDFKQKIIDSPERKEIEEALSFFILDYVGGFVDESPFDKKINIQSKYIKIQLTKANTSLQFDQIELYSNDKNIVDSGKVTYSSKFSKFKERNNKTETNGNITGDIGFHTEMEESPWWKVEFDKKISIDRIRLFNRQDWWWTRLRTFEIMTSNDGKKWKSVYQNSGIDNKFQRLEMLVSKLCTINKLIIDKQQLSDDYHYSANHISFLLIDFLNYFQHLIAKNLFSKKAFLLLREKYVLLINNLKEKLAEYVPNTIEIGGKLNNNPLTVNHISKVRFVKLELTGKEILSIDKVAVFNKKNQLISKGKKIEYSSLNKKLIAEPQNVLDNDATGMPQFQSIIETDPFLLIDLGKEQEIDKIVVYNRCDGQALRLHSLSIFVGVEKDDLAEIYSNNKDLNLIETTYNLLFPHFIKDFSFLADMALVKVRLRKNLKQAWRLLALGIRIDKTKAIKIFEKIDEATAHDELSPKLFASNHGISQKLQKNRIAVIVKSMKEIIQFFRTEFDMDVTLAYGTLLGATRENKIIPHDDDIDLVYISRQSEKKKVFEERNEIIERLIKNGFTVRKSSGNFHVRKGKGFIIDLFPSWVKDENWYVYPFVKGEIPLKEIMPNSTLKFEGHSFPVPKEYKKVLEIIYGKTWHIPDPLFRHNWGKHGEFFKFLNTYEKFIE